jgi:hypothetical protein
MTRSNDQAVADFFFFIKDNFADAAHFFCEQTLAKDIAPWAEIWKSDALRGHLLEIAMDLASLDRVLDEDEMNDRVDAQLKVIPWVSISAEVL